MASTGKKFNLTELLNQRSKEVAEPTQQEPETVTSKDGVSGTVDIYDLIPSKENFYSVEDVKDLKQSIELLGVLQPLLVTDEEEDGKRRIIAGHRRRIAVMQLVEEGKERFRHVPILIKQTQNAILDKLALIMANRFREKTDWEKMTEALETEDLVLKLKETMNIPGRTRDLLAEIIETSPAQVGRYKAIHNNIIPELMAEFKANKIGVSVVYEISGLPEDYQKQAAELFRENEVLTLLDIKQLKKQYEASKQIPGQMDIEQVWQQNDTETNVNESENHTDSEEEQTEESIELTEEPEEEFDPQPDTVTSLCYGCVHYEDCHEKKATVTNCNNYINRREAYKTAEERYDEEQAKIDAETRKRLREQQQEERMSQIPNEERQHEIRLAQSRYNEIISGQLTFLLLKKDNYKVGEVIDISEYSNGAETGRTMEIEIRYIWEDSTPIDDDWCIIGFDAISWSE